MQGEGIRAGTMNVFVRLCGCNMRCTVEPGPKSPGGFDCDTDFVSGRKVTTDEIVAWAEDEMETRVSDVYDRAARPAVIFTGGEPAVQLDEELLTAFRDRGWYTSIETNGSMDISGLDLDWVTVSPKVAEHAVRQMTADEIKYVRGYGQAVPAPRCKSANNLISPAFNGLSVDERALGWCIRLVEENPEWRLSVQAHKLWRVR